MCLDAAQQKHVYTLSMVSTVFYDGNDVNWFLPHNPIETCSEGSSPRFSLVAIGWTSVCYGKDLRMSMFPGGVMQYLSQADGVLGRIIALSRPISSRVGKGFHGINFSGLASYPA